MESSNFEVTSNIARFVSKTSAGDIPIGNYEHAKVAFLDWLAISLAGKDHSTISKLMDVVDLMGGNEHATVMGHGYKTSANQAALINGAMSHVLDFDDTMECFLAHPSTTLFPALLALSELEHKSGSEFLTAYILGIEAGAAIGTCAGPQHYLAGFHGTSSIGCLAVAAECAKLLQLDELQTVYALGIAGTMASGLRLSFGSMCKSYHAGKAAQAGLEAALLARNNFDAADNILEGKYGFFHTMHCNQSTEVHQECINSLGKSWKLDEGLLIPKYHSSDTFTHPVIDAAFDLVEEHGISWPEIKSIKVHCSPTGVDLTGNMNPQTGLQAKWSMNYCLTNALIRGDTGPAAFTDDKVQDPEIRQSMELISLEADSELISHAVRVKIELEPDQIYEKSNETPILELEVKRKKVSAKAINLSVPLLGEQKTEQLLKAVFSLETYGDMGEFVGELHQGMRNN